MRGGLLQRVRPGQHADCGLTRRGGRYALGQGPDPGPGQAPAEHLFAELAAQTHRYALEHAEDAGEGRLTFKDGIEG